MRYYPLFLDLRGRPCMIIGGGRVAERKTLTLLDAGADVTVVSPGLTPKLQALALSGRIKYKQKIFDEADIAGSQLVIAATDSVEVNSRVGRECKQKGVLANLVAPPEESSFIVPSVVDRGELAIAISTGGASPALARRIRQDLEARFGPEYDLFLQKMTTTRNRLLREVPDEAQRRAIFERLADSEVLELLRQGKINEADQMISRIAGRETEDR